MRRLIFLDIDGVLTTPETQRGGLWWFSPTAIGQLNRLIELSGAQIVLTSSWRIRSGFNLAQIRSTFATEGFRHCDHIIDSTPVLGKSRGREIKAWLDDSVEDDLYCIIDDDIDMRPYRHLLVQTDWMVGLTARDVDAALRLLGIKVVRKEDSADETDE